MRPFRKYGVILFATYLVCWTAAYIFMFLSRGDRLDFSYYFEYFFLAWTFQAGEVPAFIWLFSLMAFIPLALIIVVTMILLARRKRRQAARVGQTKGE